MQERLWELTPEQRSAVMAPGIYVPPKYILMYVTVPQKGYAQRGTHFE